MTPSHPHQPGRPGRRRGDGRQCAAFVVLAALAAGCGYTMGSGLPARGIRTVALDVVANDTYRQRLEAELSQALSRELPVSSDLMLADRRRADAILQVLFTNADERTLVVGGRDSPVREGAFEGRVRVRLIRRDGSLVLERSVLDRTEFRSPIGENLTSARQELVEDLARKIALALSDDF